MTLKKALALQTKIAEATKTLNDLLVLAAQQGYKTDAEVDTFEISAIGVPTIKYPIINTSLYVNPKEVIEDE